MLLAKLTKLLQLQTLRRQSFVFGRAVVTVFADRAFHLDDGAHNFSVIR
jgi:hypothetical protein